MSMECNSEVVWSSGMWCSRFLVACRSDMLFGHSGNYLMAPLVCVVQRVKSVVVGWCVVMVCCVITLACIEWYAVWSLGQLFNFSSGMCCPKNKECSSGVVCGGMLCGHSGMY